MFKYDTEANEWSTLTPMPCASSYHNANSIDGFIYVMGAGNDNQDFLRFDPASEVWSSLAPFSNTKESCSSFVLDRCLYVVGGYASYAASVERYDVVTDKWTDVGNILEARRGFCAVTVQALPTLVEEADLFDVLIAKSTREHA